MTVSRAHKYDYLRDVMRSLCQCPSISFTYFTFTERKHTTHPRTLRLPFHEQEADLVTSHRIPKKLMLCYLISSLGYGQRGIEIISRRPPPFFVDPRIQFPNSCCWPVRRILKTTPVMCVCSRQLECDQER
jgi:hypothetical protein